jgi:hypothetical protein
LTAFNRPQYLKEALSSWQKVRDLEDWDIYVQIEPNDFAEEQANMVRVAFQDHPSVEVLINPQVYGVLHNPWVGFERLFMAKNYDFVVRTEDDLVVSADILEYFGWAAEEFQNNSQVATVNGFTYRDGPSDEVALVPLFSPLVWGTWQDRWEGFLGPTWDHDYSTFNGEPGNQSGWDWNINTRLFPQHQLLACFPLASRVHNIGIHGVHSLPENYSTSESFIPDHGRLKYTVVDS